MKKFLLTSTLLCMLALNASAIGGIKLIQMGVRAGLAYPTLDIKNPSFDATTSIQADRKVSFTGGFVARINIPVVFFQPEIIFTANRFDLKAVTQDPNNNISSTMKINTWDVPVIVGTKFLSIVRVGVGPTFRLSCTGSAQGDNIGSSIVVPETGYIGNIGIDLGKLNIDARYTGYFGKADQMVWVGADGPAKQFKSSLSAFSISLGLLF